MESTKEIKQKIDELIANESWADAYKLVNQILSLDPENGIFIRQKNKIEAEVKKRNERAITNELESLEKLLIDSKYEEYLSKIAPLQTYINDFPIIGDKIVAAKKMLDNSYQEKRDTIVKNIEKEVKEKGESLDFEKTLAELDQFATSNFDLARINSLKQRVKQTWINKLLRENEGLLGSQKYEDTIIFLLKLKKIDSENQKVLSLITKTKDRYQEYRIESQKDFIFKTIEEIKTLYIKKSYDSAIQLCERILLIDEKNKVALDYAARSLIRANSESEKQISRQIKENYLRIKQDSSLKDNLVKI